MKIDAGIKRTVDGVEQTIIIEAYRAYYPTDRIVRKIIGIPTEKGKRAPHYIHMKAYLGDDWDSDLTDSWFEVGTLPLTDQEKLQKMLDNLG